MFSSGLTEVWQVRIDEGEEKAAKAKVAWEKFVHAVSEAGGVAGDGKSFYGPSLNLEDRRWLGALGWESNEVRSDCLLVLVRMNGDASADSTILDQGKGTQQYCCQGS